MQTVSAITITSNALVRLGEESISSFEENTKIDDIAQLYFTQRDALLRSHPWNCAIRRKVLAAEVAPAVPVQVDYANTYPLPADCLRLLQVGEFGYEPDYKLEGRRILCDESPLRLRYIYKNYDEATWDAMLVEGMTLAMIAVMAYAITESTSKEATAIKAVNDYLRSARAVDGQEDPPEMIGDEYLVTARARRVY